MFHVSVSERSTGVASGTPESPRAPPWTSVARLQLQEYLSYLTARHTAFLQQSILIQLIMELLLVTSLSFCFHIGKNMPAQN
jgi:hypothetical protein